MKNFRFIKIPDVFLFCFLLAVPIFAIMQQNEISPQNPVAIVEIDSKQKYSIALNEQKEIQLNEWNLPVILDINPSKVRILKNDCQKKICIHTGYIEKSGQSIVCVPKKILIYIQSSSGNNSDKIDAITG